VSWYQKGKTNLDFTGARDSEWQWHQLGHMQVCTLLQTEGIRITSCIKTFIHKKKKIGSFFLRHAYLIEKRDIDK